MTDTDDGMGYAYVDESLSTEDMIAAEQSEVSDEFEASQVIGDTDSVEFLAVDDIIGN